MDKGIFNTRGSHITVSGSEGEKDIVLMPGVNRLSDAQFKKLQSDRVCKMLFSAKIIREESLEEPKAEPKKTPAKAAAKEG